MISEVVSAISGECYAKGKGRCQWSFLCVCPFPCDSAKQPQMKLNVTWSMRMSREFTAETDVSAPGSRRFQGQISGPSEWND